MQQDIFDDDGQFTGRVDFLWKEQRTIGEFDGKIKYGRLLRPGQSLEEVLFAEKVREDALRDLGWQIVRWLWADLYRRGVIRDRVLRALARAPLDHFALVGCTSRQLHLTRSASN